FRAVLSPLTLGSSSPPRCPGQLAAARFVKLAARASAPLFFARSMFARSRASQVCRLCNLAWQRSKALSTGTIKKLIGNTALTLVVLVSAPDAFGKKRIPPGGRVAVVVDERL